MNGFTLRCPWCNGQPFASIEPNPAMTQPELQQLVENVVDSHIHWHTDVLVAEIEEELSGQEPR